MAEQAPLTVLLVEDDAVYARILRSTLAFAGWGPWALEWVASFGAARERLVRGGVDAVLLDLSLPDVSGLEAVVRLGTEFPRVPVVILTARDDEALALSAVQRGAQDYLVKGKVEEDLLGRSVRHAIERKRTTDTVRQLEKAVGTMQLGVTFTDPAGRILYLNAAEAEMHGYSAAELLGQDARSLSPREDWRPLSPEQLRGLGKWKRERVRLRKDGSAFPVQLTSDVVTDAAGQPVGIVTTCEDITERKAAEAALRESEERYALAARGTNDGLWDWSLKDDRLYFSPRWKAMLGYQEHEIGDSPAEWLDRVHPDDQPKVRSKLAAHVEGRAPNFEVEHRIRHKDESYRWVLSRGFAVRDAEGRPYRMAGAQTDVTDRRAYDPLTGLPNRALLAERLSYAFARAKRRPDYLFAVIFMDLDHFKVINDGLGHLRGDQVLIGLARRLEACVRPGDTVGRLAGDEFALLLETIRDVADATQVAERIQKEMAAPLPAGGHDVVVSASMGIALSATGYERPEDLLRDADTAMYRAKSLGRSRYEVFEGAMHDRLATRLALEAQLRRAVEDGHFRLHFQPIVRLATGEVEALEALLRWVHPEGRLVLPGEFLPVAEETGLMVPIGSWVLRQVCRQIREWQARLPGAARLAVSINLSARQFARAGLAEEVEEALRDCGLPPRALRLEVRESLLLEKPQWAVPVLSRLRALGVQVHLDDFGTGHSSLTGLHRFPLDGLKVDGTVLVAAELGHPEGSLLRSVLELAQGLGLEVVAEGVETEGQVATLRALGCALAQGRYFFEPLDAAAAGSLIAAGGRWPAPPRAVAGSGG